MSVVEDIDGYFALLAQGIDIWADVLKWILSGGRRRPDVVASKEAPWTEGAGWRRIYERLQAWRQRHGSRIRFPDVNAGIHVALKGGHGEAFAYINLVYHVSILFLCREYIPFLPTPVSRPSGPVDPPLLDDSGPPGWWEDRANDLFTASSNISTLLRQLKDEDACLLTPFAGFCAFSAATMNIYVACFPQMNLGRSSGREADFESDLAYLSEFRTIWPLGTGWWKAAQRTMNLYRRASIDYSTFEGKTRDNFIRLESSMHSCTGVSSELGVEDDAAYSPASTTSGLEISDHVSQESAACNAAIGLQELSYSHTIGETALPSLQIMSNWNEPLGLWGDHQLDPLGVAGTFYDYQPGF
ncbi:putative fungal specific transcription factor [Fusarium sporotrichioides]|uniref:Putative fungal specific transcription factor n=1 Tax=Fusarium sporotrichioides TaxID=5514 RepID=A0A395RE85_FUSSP|nr:putative fungal specific transcription factor [Fusarium sporotrichioides]